MGDGGREKGQRIYSNSPFFGFGADGVIVISLLPPFLSSPTLGCATASLHGALRAGVVGDECIPLVPPRPSDEMGFFFFSGPLLSQGRDRQEARRTGGREETVASNSHAGNRL